MKWTHLSPLIGLSLCFLAQGCKYPVHLSYDYGRAFQATFPVQADLTRESVLSLQHPLGGIEGVAIRLNVTDEASDGEDASTTLTAGTGN